MRNRERGALKRFNRSIISSRSGAFGPFGVLISFLWKGGPKRPGTLVSGIRAVSVSVPRGVSRELLVGGAASRWGDRDVCSLLGTEEGDAVSRLRSDPLTASGCRWGRGSGANGEIGAAWSPFGTALRWEAPFPFPPFVPEGAEGAEGAGRVEGGAVALAVVVLLQQFPMRQ